MPNFIIEKILKDQGKTYIIVFYEILSEFMKYRICNVLKISVL